MFFVFYEFFCLWFLCFFVFLQSQYPVLPMAHMGPDGQWHNLDYRISSGKYCVTNFHINATPSRFGSKEFREWMKLVICFSVLHSHGLGAGTVTQRALVVLRPFFALTHTSSSLSLLCRREVPFHWTLNDTFLFSWRAAEKRRTWVTHNKETHINCIYLF